MARFDASMEAMAEMYIYETKTLLEELDEILLNAESNNAMTEADINEIFRIMHTIKGSSAMMGLENMSLLGHAIEDLFFVLREDKTLKYDMEELNNSVFSAADLLKEEIELLSTEDEPTDFSELIDKIHVYIEEVKGSNGGKSKSGKKTSKKQDEKTTTDKNSTKDENAIIPKLDNTKMTEVCVRFKEECQMENLRALILINSIKDRCKTLEFEPADIETNMATAEMIVNDGFIIKFIPVDTVEELLDSITNGLNVETVSILDNHNIKNFISSGDDGMITVKVYFEDGCQMENLRALLLITTIRDNCEVLEYEPADIETNSASARHIISNGFIVNFKPHKNTSKEQIINDIAHVPNVKAYEIISENAVTNDKEDQKDSGKKKTTAVKEAKNSLNLGNSKQTLISVNLNKLDRLLDLMAELIIAEAAVVSNSDLVGLKLDNFQKSSRRLKQLTNELQDVVMSTRMLPISGAFNKMNRIVRDMKIKLGKDVDLVFVGEDTEVDKSVIDNLNDPLMHMVRNAMDHGIETKEEFAESGKTEKSKITLSAFNSAGEVIISVSDNGKGIDDKKILEIAKNKGLLNKPESEYSHKEICNLVMYPGFSTNDEVTEFSGRGVGTDVVRSKIEQIGGTINVESRLGEGTSFIMRIPLSLAIIEGIDVLVGETRFIIPIDNIEENFKVLDKQDIMEVNGHEMVNIRGICYPLIKLHEIYNIESAQTEISEGIVVLVNINGEKAGIFVDNLIGEQQIVVKPFPYLLSKFQVKEKGMAGCGILGDGSITIVLDVNTIVKEY